MTTFARIVDGFTTDVRVHASATDLAACFHPEWLAAHPFIIVPDGTPHAAKDNGNGTYTPTQSPVPAVSDVALTKDAFIDHCIAQFGNLQRYGAIMVAAKGATDSTVGAYIEKYAAMSAVTKAQAQAFFTAVRAANLPAGAVVTIPEITNVVVNWPKA